MRPYISRPILLFAALTLGSLSAKADSPLRLKVGDLRTITASPTQEVELVGTIAAAFKEEFVFEDDSGPVWVYSKTDSPWTAGDRIRLVCTVACDTLRDDKRPSVSAYRIDVLSKGSPPAVLNLTPQAFADGKGDNRTVRLTGVITDTFLDEIDPNFQFFTLESCGESISIACRVDSTVPPDTLFAFIDREVEAVGICRTDSAGLNRQPFCRTLSIEGLSSIRLLNRCASSPFDAANQLVLPPNEDTKNRNFPHRQWVTGTVLVAWGGDSFYLQTEQGSRVRVSLMPGLKTPSSGEKVAVSGFVRFRGSFIRLSNAVCRKDQGAGETLVSPVLTNPRTILYDDDGKLRIQPHHEGELMRIAGEVRDISGGGTPDGKILTDSNGILIPVLSGSLPSPAIGSRVEITGVCQIICDPDERPNGFLHFTGISLIPRTEKDIVLVSAPPWWTPARLTILVVCLIALLLGVAVWNRMLRALADRRGRELMSEQIDRITAELKAEERTRLAVELHDSLSQTLTGVSCEIDAATEYAGVSSAPLKQHLSLASKSLESCRLELRNCLWDLRSQALEAEDMNEAIRLALLQVAKSARISIRFNIPRARFLDSTAHAVLRIIRELTSNAIRHGKATAVRIAGHAEPDRLLFSVTDNGCGFDIRSRPGSTEGHYGLQGIRERLDALDGKIEIRSSSGRGTKAMVSLKIPQLGKES